MKISSRIYLIQAFVFGALCVLAVALFHAQVIQGGQYRRTSEHNRMRLIRLEAPRGNIYDRSGVLIADTRPAYHAYVIPEDFDPQDLPDLSRLLNLSQEEIRKQISGSRSASFTPILLKQDISKELAMQIEERRPRLRGVFININTVRSYPQGESAAHIIGYIGKISKQEYENGDRSIYYPESWTGKIGIEKKYDLLLRGEDGGRQIEVDARGIPMRLLNEKKPVRGQDLYLTIDLKMESVIQKSLNGKKAAALMMDIETGEILAAVSTPGFDPNVFVDAGRSRERMTLLGSDEKPLLNRGFNGVYPPGSVFKLVTAMAGLENGVITPQTTFQCPGYFKFGPNSRKFKCWFSEGHGPINLYTALERSCNVYFYNVGRLLGEKRLSEYARKLGFGSSVDLGIPTASGTVPDAEWKKEKFKDRWYPGDTISFAIGQSYLLVSPLQILRLVAAIASDGNLMDPKIVKSEEVVLSKKVPAGKDTFKTIRQGMLQVVASDKGTGQLARVEFTKLAAKTGTAQAPPGVAHAWFAGFFPYESPKIALVVFVERGQSGGITAAKIAKQIVEQWNQIYGLKIS